MCHVSRLNPTITGAIFKAKLNMQDMIHIMIAAVFIFDHDHDSDQDGSTSQLLPLSFAPNGE
jgi:hypothetical protein